MRASSHKKQLIENINVLLLARNEDIAAIDRQTLRGLKSNNIQFINSGLKAAVTLSNILLNYQKLPDVIVCHEQLNDMHGIEFINLLQLHPSLRRIPIILTISYPIKTPEETFYIVLQRPYSSADLLQAISSAQNNVKKIPIPESSDTIAFETALEYLSKEQTEPEITSEGAYKLGLKAIRKKDWDEAITQLRYTILRQPENTHALLALATAWKGKGSIRKYRDTLFDLLYIYIKNHKWEHAKSINQRLVKSLNEASNPLYNKASEFLSIGNISDAAQAIIAGHIPVQEELLYEQISKGCALTPNPQKTAQQLQEYLKHVGETALAELLAKSPSKPKKRLLSSKRSKQTAHSYHSDIPNDTFSFFLNTDTQKSTQKKKDEASPLELMDKVKAPSFLRSLPLLQDAITVLKFTYHMFRSSKKK